MKVFLMDPVHPWFKDACLNKGWEITENLSEAEVIIVRNTSIQEKLIEQIPSLKIIGRAGAGLDNIDTVAAIQKKIHVVHAGGANAPAVAEHTLGMVLALLNHIHTAHQEVIHGIWNRESNRGRELSSLIWGLIGFGHTGQALGTRLKALGVQVLVYDKYLHPIDGPPGFKHVEEKELLKKADIVSLHIPLTDETRGKANLDWYKKMKNKAILVNVSRGEIAPLKDAITWLESPNAGGLAFDVLDIENPNLWGLEYQSWMEKLRQMPNVIFSPHVAGWTHESHLAIAQQLFYQMENLENL